MLYLPLRTVKYISKCFEEKLSGYNLKWYIINELSKAVIIDDSLILLIEIYKSDMPVCENAEEHYAWTLNNKYIDIPKRGQDYYELRIEELTYNSLGFKYNHLAFMREMSELLEISHLEIDIKYTKFKGYTRLYWCPERETTVEYIGKILPELCLRERYEAWEGIHYYFIVMEMKSAQGNIEYAVAYTTQKPHTYINSQCGEWLKHGIKGGDFRTRKLLFFKAFNSWKGVPRKKRLEESFAYFFVEKYLREKDAAWRYADTVLENAYNNQYVTLERSTYTKPVNKWVTEELVYNTVKNIYKGYRVIWQHRPFFLRSEKGGQMSYDVFIPALNIAIEYQGEQHFKPIDFFGGEDSYNELIQRDKLKQRLSKQNNIKLIYINYWEDISSDLIKNRIEEALIGETVV